MSQQWSVERSESVVLRWCPRGKLSPLQWVSGSGSPVGSARNSGHTGYSDLRQEALGSSRCTHCTHSAWLQVNREKWSLVRGKPKQGAPVTGHGRAVVLIGSTSTWSCCWRGKFCNRCAVATTQMAAVCLVSRDGSHPSSSQSVSVVSVAKLPRHSSYPMLLCGNIIMIASFWLASCASHARD